MARQRCHLRLRLGLQLLRVASIVVGLIVKCNLALVSLFDTRPRLLEASAVRPSGEGLTGLFAVRVTVHGERGGAWAG